MYCPLIPSRLTGVLLGLTLLASPSFADNLLRISGSITIGEHLAPALAAEFLEQQNYQQIRIQQLSAEGQTKVTGSNAAGENLTVQIKWQGSGHAFADLTAGQADIGATSRPINEPELKGLAQYGNLRSPRTEEVIALDGIALIVHPSNPLDSINLEQAAAIFSGKINNWQELGGADQPIQRFARDEHSGTWAQFQSQVLGKQNTLAENSHRFDHNDELSEALAAVPQGIGFVPVSAIGQNKPLALHTDSGTQISPDYAHITTEDYPLTRRLYLYRLPTDKPLAEAFFDFVASDAGQAVVSENGFIGQQVQVLPKEFNLDLDEAYRKLVADYQRLSVNFRFHGGSSDLDNKALTDTERLAEYLQTQPEARILLVGFAEGGNGFERTLSKLRAQAIRSELIKAGIKRSRIKVKGQGAQRELPSASEEQSKLRNRRVEAWITQI